MTSQPGNAIDLMLEGDWPSVEAIYLEGIATGNATLEERSPGWEEWDNSHLPFARFVARNDGDVVGWCAVSPVSRRAVYAGVAEVSVYIKSSARGQGFGRLLLARLVEECEQQGIWTLQAGILSENTASISLHLKCGFREVGRRERLGKLKDRWRDVVLLERRSSMVGND
jgi:L-amino acid N-acyltransferase YncA